MAVTLATVDELLVAIEEEIRGADDFVAAGDLLRLVEGDTRRLSNFGGSVLI